MVLSQLSVFASNGQSYNNDNNSAANNMDSINLQFKQVAAALPKPKAQLYDFKYEDEDTVMNEIEEFFSYKEIPHLEENLKAWEGSFPGEWIRSTYAKRKAHVEVLLEGLEHRDVVVRFTNARRLLYVLQGTFVETTSPEHQLHWIIENCKIIRAANGISSIVEAMRLAYSKHELMSQLSDSDARRLHVSPAEKQDCIEELNTELSVYLDMLYLLVEVLKDNDDFADELMSLDPPLPVYLFNVIAGLRDRITKDFPVKKVLLLLWKTLLACCGGSRDLLRVKKIARELAGLPEEREEQIPIKSSPFDMQTFRYETSVKYPTFTSNSASGPGASRESQSTLGERRNPNFTISTLKLAEAYSPIPVRHHYHHGDESDFQPPGGPPSNQNFGQPAYPTGNPAYNPTTQPLTPVPTPPPSPKPKKQQYQTDQNRPFLFPFSRSQVKYRGRGNRLVPFAIDEADRLYNKHMHISVALLQMWRTREDCMIEESGLQRLPGVDGFNDTFDSILSLNSGGSGSWMSCGPAFDRKVNTPTSREEAVDIGEDQPDVALLNAKISETEEAIRQIGRSDDRANNRKLKELRERREDLLRLRRVEQIYSGVLPLLSACVIVSLKMLLASVSAPNNNQPPPSASSAAFPPGVSTSAEQQPPQPPPTLEEIDIMRHREIMAKAVSAILLMALKWFKASHVMKFHYLGQLLLETNCLLLILKIFTLQEISNTVASKADSPENGFFRSSLKFSRNPHVQRPEDGMLGPPRQSAFRSALQARSAGDEEEIELITDFSWRNFFSTINLVKIMQKLSKHRSHRILILVQYKSAAVLKRVLKISHPMLELNVLKLIKNQVPYCGRKWRQSNMKVITSIYLKCRPDLRDEWLTGSEVDDAQDALAQEQALRKLIKFYNSKRYGSVASHAASRDSHRRSSSLSVPLEGLPGAELSAMVRPVGTPNIVEADVFPPLRAQAPDPSIFLPYTTEDIAFEEEYEEYLSDLGMSEEHPTSDGALFGGTSAWHRLPHIGSELADGISDSESIGSIGELGDETKFDASLVESDREAVDENRNNWEHMSPKTMAALPKSPVGVHRRSSSGSSLRPVLPFGLDDNSAIELEEGEEEEPEMGPMPREQHGPFAQGAGVDEVEYVYGL